MSSDESELTFIRCPSCRSLVPAVASRCRMCGQALAGATDGDKHGTANDEQSGEKASRVRKKTISFDGEDREAAQRPKTKASADKDYQSVDGDQEHERQVVQQVIEPPKETVSPVSKFLKYGLKDQSKPAPETSATTDKVPDQQSSKFTLGREPLRFGRQTTATEVKAPVKAQPPVEEESIEEEIIEEEYPEEREANANGSEVLEVFNDDTDDYEEDGEEEDEGDFGEEDVVTPSATRPLTKSQKRRLRKKKRAALAGTQGQAGTPQPGVQTFSPSRPQPEVKAEVRPEPKPLVRPEVRSETRTESRPPMQQPLRPTPPQFERPTPVTDYVQPTKSIEVERKPMAQINQPTTEAPRVLKAKTDGRLIGWLIAYRSDYRGAPIEIREGRFFIGGAKLRDTDLVFADDSLSVPHCLVKAESRDGLVIQDLMSEHGTFVKRSGTSSYEAITMPTVIEHGDWIKFGDYELMACVIPADGRAQDQ